METIKLSNDETVHLESVLNQIITGFRDNYEVTKYVKTLKAFLSEYRSSGTYIHSEIRADIPNIIGSLKPVSRETGKTVAELVKQSCKGCIFHSDNCMINIIYIVFKSLELQKQVEFKDVRPNMRILIS